jgi:WD40 repeat protein
MIVKKTFTQFGKILIIFISSLSVSLFAQGAPDIVWSIAGHTSSVESIGFSYDGLSIVSGGGTEAKIWQASDGTLLQTVTGFASNLLSVDISSDNSLLAAGYVVGTYPPGGVMDVMDLVQGSTLYHFGGCFVKFSPDASLIASGGGGVNRYVVLHRLSDGTEMGAFNNGPGYIKDVEFSPNGQIIAAALTDNTVNLWDIASGTIIRTLSGHSDDVSTIDFSPDGELLASGAGGFDNPGESTIKIWQVSNGSLIRTLEGHGDWVYDLSFSPDGQTLISCGRDGIYPSVNPKIKIWRVSDGSLLQYYDQELSNAAISIDFSPDGATYTYGRSDGTVTVANNPFLTGISNDADPLPQSVHLYQNYPNPFNPITRIEFNLLRTSKVSLKIFNALGEEVTTLLSASLFSGSHSIKWNASGLPSGVYFYRLETDGYVETRKMVLMR